MNCLNRTGRDAFTFAAAPSKWKSSADGYRDVLYLLADCKADLCRKDKRGQSAIDCANEEGRNDFVKCLLELKVIATLSF